MDEAMRRAIEFDRTVDTITGRKTGQCHRTENGSTTLTAASTSPVRSEAETCMPTQ